MDYVECMSHDLSAWKLSCGRIFCALRVRVALCGDPRYASRSSSVAQRAGNVCRSQGNLSLRLALGWVWVLSWPGILGRRSW